MKKQLKKTVDKSVSGKDYYSNKLTPDDLKGKKVDAFPDVEEDKPLVQKKNVKK